MNLYQPGDLIQEDLYFLYQGSYLLYRLKNLLWKEEDRKKLEEFEISHLFVKCKTPREHNQFLEARLKRILEEPGIPSLEKAEVIYSVSTSLMEELFEKPESPEKLKRSMGAIQNSIDFLGKDKKHFFELMSFASTHFTEFAHGLHTAAYSIMLAKQLGYRSFNQLSPLGVAAILHDIGKTKVPRQILEKSEILDESERIEVEKHPEYGFEIVHRARAVPDLSETIILQHHERPKGNGYPKHLQGEMHLFSQIVAICDCFDLLTSERPYKHAMKPVDAIEYLRTTEAANYNQDLVVSFIAMLKR